MAVCNLSNLATVRRLVARALTEDATAAAVVVDGVRPEIGVWVGPAEWAIFAAAVRRERPHMESYPNPFDELEGLLSETHSRHRDENPAVIVLGALDVARDPGLHPRQGLYEVPL
jgi:hypothetical protein